MTSFQLYKGLSNIDAEFLADIERYSFTKRKHAVRPQHAVLAAIICLLALLLAGCGIVYALHLKQLKIGTEALPIPETDSSEGQTLPEIQLTVFSLQGIQGTPNYLANQEWLAYTQHYVASDGEYWESDPAYWAYSVQNQEMVDMLDEICSKYGLEIIGKPWHEQIDCNQFLPLLGIKSLLKPDAAASLSIPSGRYFQGGSFTIYGTLDRGDTSVMFTYQYVKKDVFYDVFGYANADTVTQRNYTTADGVPLLFLESEQSGMILADKADAFISINVTMTGNVSLEQIAECFDFTIRSTAPDPAAADARERASDEEIISMQGDPNIGRRATYAEYVQDLIRSDEQWRALDAQYTPSVITYAFYDADGNGQDELLIFYSGYIGSIVGMKDGLTDEGKSYHLTLCEDNVFIHWPTGANGRGEYCYHIFRFANNGDPVFSNPKEQSIVRLKKDADGSWWRTSSTEHYAEFDTRITEEEAQSILNSYAPVQLKTLPLSEFREQ